MEHLWNNGLRVEHDSALCMLSQVMDKITIFPHHFHMTAILLTTCLVLATCLLMSILRLTRPAHSAPPPPGGYRIIAGPYGPRFQDPNGKIFRVRPEPGVPGSADGVAASATLAPSGDDNDILVTAKMPGVAGNDLTAAIAIEEDSADLTVEEADGQPQMIVTADFGDGVETVYLQNTSSANWSFEAAGNVRYDLYSSELDGAGLVKIVDSVVVAEFGGSHPGSGSVDDVNDWSAVFGTATGTPTVVAAAQSRDVVVTSGNKRRMIIVVGGETLVLIPNGETTTDNAGVVWPVWTTNGVPASEAIGANTAWLMAENSGWEWKAENSEEFLTISNAINSPGVGASGYPDEQESEYWTAAPATAAQAIDAINADSALPVIAANAPGNDGSGVLAAASETSLTGGVNPENPGEPGDMIYDADNFYLRTETGWETIPFDAG